MAMLESEEPCRVLVVDDEQVIREILADFLSMEGFSVRTAEDGASALEELSRTHYDLILSDLKMPKMGGLELLTQAKEKNPEVVVIIMTGFGTVESAINAMKQGAFDYVLKPFKVEDVILTVRRGLEMQQLQAENIRLREAVSLYRVSEAITASLSLDEVLDTVVTSILSELDADEALIMLRDEAGVLRERVRERNSKLDSHLPSVKLDAEALESFFQNERTFRMHGARTRDYIQLPPSGVVQSLTVTSLRIRGTATGYLCAMSYTRNKRFNEGQRKLLSIVADRAAAAIDNANLYEGLKATFHQTIEGLASAIDKMDRYTAGHSQRVSMYAHALARKLQLEDEEAELIRQSALMHDIGKIGCMINLNKPDRLTYEEYEIFKKHPEYGRDILRPITFLRPLIPGVYLHHERWDGKGYPTGIAGSEIPLMARVITVADTYDAMTSDRAYRRALPHDVALQEIHRCSGTQFDPQAAGAFEEALASIADKPVLTEPTTSLQPHFN